MAAGRGLYWIGPIHDRGGYGNAARNYLRGLRKIGYPVKAFNLYGHDPASDHRNELPPAIVSELQELEQTPLSGNLPLVIQSPPDGFRKLYKWVNLDGLRFTKRIGWTIFETDRIPPKWVDLCRQVDEIWVPTDFNIQTFSGCGVPVDRMKIIPISVDTEHFRPMHEKLQIPGRRGFLFLSVSVFDWRKGFDLLLEAYLREFTSNDDVTLLLKIYAGAGERRNVKSLINDAVRDKVDLGDPGLPHFEIWDEPMTQDNLKRLYNACDLFVSTERATGWGMPCMEAMAMGKPAAAIDWSGCTAFMNQENSLLIRSTGQLVDVDPRLAGDRPIYAGHKWAEVRIEEVRRVLRLAFERRDILLEIGRRGMEEIRERYSLDVVAKRIVETIESGSPAPWFRTIVPERFRKFLPWKYIPY
ncbi:MAG: glycosyltransferase family 4 protein [bacterium]|nr:glycosyltransferase family 4 protein [bacterium]